MLLKLYNFREKLRNIDSQICEEDSLQSLALHPAASGAKNVDDRLTGEDAMPDTSWHLWTVQPERRCF